MRRKEVLLALGWYNHRINEGVARYARKAGWFLNCCYIHQSALPENWCGDGIITLLGDDADDPLIGFVKKHLSKRAVVDLTMCQPKIKCGRVLDNNLLIGRLGAEHFINRQFRRIGFFRTHDSWSANLRLDGFLVNAKKHGTEVIDLDWIAHYPGKNRQMNLQRDWLAEKLKKITPPIGVMAVNDEQAVTVLLAAQQAGLDVPEQVAVLGVDNDPFAGELAPVPLSSIPTDPAAQGFRAGELLDEMMTCQHADKTAKIILDPKPVVVRRSTDTCAVDDPRVAQALGFIRENYSKPISTELIAEELSMSRRRLHDLFLREVRHSVHDEIVIRRIDHAVGLLKSTDWPLKKIAARCGFTSAEHLCKTFSRELNKTPSQLRE